MVAMITDEINLGRYGMDKRKDETRRNANWKMNFTEEETKNPKNQDSPAYH